ncbi:MAG: hypothetical protein JKY48_09700 [Flavobacteriales bacterium]|nr:hypothetical protein [Flavobacteriales bacterium]
MKTQDSQLPADVLPKADAIQYATNWQAGHLIKGFVVPLNDFKKITEEQGVENARIYMGIHEGEEKLMMVGVNSAGEDMIDYEGEPKQYIYDFTTPCPKMCDESSPLYITES